MTELERLKAKREQLVREQEAVRMAAARVAGALTVIDQLIAGIEAEQVAKPVKVKRAGRKANGAAGEAKPADVQGFGGAQAN